MAISDEIELFLRNALREKALEDRLVKRALKDLRSTLGAIEQLVASSGALSLGINRERTIAAISSAVARNVQQTWGIPQLASLQQALEPFIEAQLEFGRKMVEAAGGTLATPGAASLNVAQAVNDAVVGGKTLSTQLTQTFPALVADRVERYVRLGLNQASGEVLETIAYQDAVVAVTERNVEALIRTGVHEVGSVAQMAIYEFEADPDWLEGKLTWTAVLDSAACPICIGLDGKDYELGTPGPYFDGRNKISPHPNCRCYVVPAKWRDDDMTSPSGDAISARRPAEGDKGESTVTFKKAAKSWVKENPETARQIFGKRLGDQLVAGTISFDKAVKQWSGNR